MRMPEPPGGKDGGSPPGDPSAHRQTGGLGATHRWLEPRSGHRLDVVANPPRRLEPACGRSEMEAGRSCTARGSLTVDRSCGGSMTIAGSVGQEPQLQQRVVQKFV